MIKPKKEGSKIATERLLLTGIIVSNKVANDILPILDPHVLSTKYSTTIAGWCKEYWEKHRAAPKKHIKNIYEIHKKDNDDDPNLEIIEEILASLSKFFVEESEKAAFNEKYVSDEAEKHIKECTTRALCANVEGQLDRGNVTEAELLIAQYRMPKLASSESFDVMTEEFWNVPEEDDRQVLFSFNGALGEVFGDFERDSLIGVLGKEKIGKTNLSLHIALEAYKNRCNTLFIGVGDMTVPQIRGRIRRMITGFNPKHNKEDVFRPVLDCLHNQKGECPLGEDTDPIYRMEDKRECRVSFADYPQHTVCVKCHEKMREKENYDKFVGSYWHRFDSVSKFKKPIEDALKYYNKCAYGARLKLLTYPGKGINVGGIEKQIEILKDTEGFIPDMVVLDYADVLDAEDWARKSDERHKINSNWIAMRALSQKLNCCVVVPTQGDKASGRLAQLTTDNISEDKRKAAHVTAMYALNQTPQEKRDGIMRVSCILKREDEFDYSKNAVLLQSLTVGRYNLASYIENNYGNYDEL